MRPYEKPALTIEQQADQLLARGLVCADPAKLHHYLRHVGYYRLSAYGLPFEVPRDADAAGRTHVFVEGTTFDQILDLYIFDRKLRLVVLEALERIETAARSLWADALALAHGPHAYMRPELFDDPWGHTSDIAHLARDLTKSSETFVKHYRATYDTPHLPPVWAVAETMSFGALSRWIKATRDSRAKNAVARGFGLPTNEVMQSVLHALTPVRNTCAHHARLWNRHFVLKQPLIRRLEGSMAIEEIRDDRGRTQRQPRREIYNHLVVIEHMMRRINPGSGWRARLMGHVETATEEQRGAMGFPADWRTRTPWGGVR